MEAVLEGGKRVRKKPKEGAVTEDRELPSVHHHYFKLRRKRKNL